MDQLRPVESLNYSASGWLSPEVLSPALVVRVLAAIIAVTAFGEVVASVSVFVLVQLERLRGVGPTISLGEPWGLAVIAIAISLLEAIAAIAAFQFREGGRRLLVVMLAVEIIMHLIGSGEVAYHSWAPARWQKAYALMFASSGLYGGLVPAIEWWFFRRPSVVRFFRGEEAPGEPTVRA